MRCASPAILIQELFFPRGFDLYRFERPFCGTSLNLSLCLPCSRLHILSSLMRAIYPDRRKIFLVRRYPIDIQLVSSSTSRLETKSDHLMPKMRLRCLFRNFSSTLECIHCRTGEWLAPLSWRPPFFLPLILVQEDSIVELIRIFFVRRFWFATLSLGLVCHCWLLIVTVR